MISNNTTDDSDDEQSIETFNYEPHPGHHIGVKITEQPSILDNVIASYGGVSPHQKRATITVGDVDWDETQEIEMDTDSLEAIARWYLERVQRMPEDNDGDNQ
jgi:hypothetical protein